MIVNFKGKELDFSKEFKRINYTERINEILGFNVLDYTDVNKLKSKIVETGLFSMNDFEDCKTVGGVIDFIYKRKIRENYRLIQNKLAKGYNIVFLWNKKVPIESANFHIIGEDMHKSFQKAGILIQ